MKMKPTPSKAITGYGVKMNGDLKLGDVFKAAGYPDSEIVGIDRYKMKTLSGKDKSWSSFTLIPKEPSSFDRWWASETEGGFYCWEPATIDEMKGKLDLDQSGLSVLDVEGNSIVSSLYSASIVFRDGEQIYCQEAFENEVLYMKAHFRPS